MPAESRRKPGRKPRPASPFPDLQALTAGLQALLRRDRPGGGTLTVLRREPNVYESTFPSEVVTCRLADGSWRRLFCKYSADLDNSDHGHRGGVAYEAEVYRQVLRPSRALTPRFYGTYTDDARSGTWLVLEYLDGGHDLVETPEPEAELLAARWIGRFHAAQEGHAVSAPVAFLNRCDAAYYSGWARRAAAVVRPWHGRYPWVGTLCERFEGMLDLLSASPLTVIHGEYYPLNILVRGSVVYPVDWESAAVGAGEIDLASLTEGWPEEGARRIAQEYQRARWPDGPPAEFEQRLAMSRLYLSFRWLADGPEPVCGESVAWYLRRLRSAGKRCGLI